MCAEIHLVKAENFETKTKLADYRRTMIFIMKTSLAQPTATLSTLKKLSFCKKDYRNFFRRLEI